MVQGSTTALIALAPGRGILGVIRIILGILAMVIQLVSSVAVAAKVARVALATAVELLLLRVFGLHIGSVATLVANKG